MKTYYFLNLKGQWVGPLVEKDLVLLYQHGSLSRDTQVKEEGSEESAPYNALTLTEIASPRFATDPKAASPGQYPAPGPAYPNAPHYPPAPRNTMFGCLARWLLYMLVMISIGFAVRLAILAYLVRQPGVQQQMEQLRQLYKGLNLPTN